MKQKALSMLLVVALATGMLAGCGEETGPESSESKSAESVGTEDTESESKESEEEVDLSAITYGPYGWKIDTSYDYSGPEFKRFDGLTFTRIVNGTGDDIPEGQTMDDNERVWEMQLKTGLTPETLWYAAGDAYNSKVSTAIASGEIPDFMKVGISEYYMLVKSGIIADLTDELFSGNHPQLMAMYEATDNVALEAFEIDGRIYGIPQANLYFDGSPLVWIRTDWLNELGLEEPKSYADLAKIAKAFMDADFDGNGRNDTYGIPILTEFSASYGGDGSLADLFVNVGGAAPGIWQRDDDGDVVYGSLMDGAKEALVLLNDWYNQGIIPEDFATWNGDMLKQQLGDNKAGIVFAPWWATWSCISTSYALNPEATWEAYMLPGEEGGEIRSVAGGGNPSIYVVRKDFEEPAAFVYAANSMAGGGYHLDQGDFGGDDYTCPNTYGWIGASNWPTLFARLWDTHGEAILKTKEVKTVEEGQAIAAANNNFGAGYVGVYFQNMPIYDAREAGESERGFEIEGKSEVESYGTYLGYIEGQLTIGEVQPKPVDSIFKGVTESMELYNSFLGQYEKEEYVKMIMGNTGGKTVSEYFDNFVKSYLDQGGAEILAEVIATVG